MTRLVRLARLLVVALLLYAAYPVAVALLRGEIDWSGAVDAFVTDRTTALVLLLALACLALTFLRSPLVRTVLAAAAVLVLVGLVTGRVTPVGLGDSVREVAGAERLSDAATECGYDLSVERFGEGLRTFLRTPEGATETVGYVAERVSGGFRAVVDDGTGPREVVCGP